MNFEELPEFPRFVALGLEHKEVIQQSLAKYPAAISDLNFTEMYGWRNSYQVRVTRLRGNLALFVETQDNHYFFPPVGDKEFTATVKDMLEWQKQEKKEPKAFGFNEEQAQLLKEAIPGLATEELRDSADYVYLRSDLVELKGNKYHSKKNLVKQFQSQNAFEFLPLTKEMVPECVAFQHCWNAKKGEVPKTLLKEDNDMTLQLLEHMGDLDIFGAVLKVEGKVRAYTIAGELNPETAVVHVEKADPTLKGVYQALNQMFCEKMLGRYQFVNREQDMGDLGLRKAKLSYHPHHLVNKTMVRIEK